MNPFSTALVKAPKRATFDMSHDNTVSVSLGEGCPTYKAFVIPGDEVSLSMEQIVRLAPIPVPTFVPLKVRHDFFFVPLRLMYGQDTMDTLFGSQVGSVNRASCENLIDLYKTFTGFQFDITEDDSHFAQSLDIPTFGTGHVQRFSYPLPSSLLDYLGYPVLTDRNGGLTESQIAAINSDDVDTIEDAFSGIFDNSDNYIAGAMASSPAVNVEPIIAYHYIWRDWYRFTGVESNDLVEPYLNNHFLTEWSQHDHSEEPIGDNIPSNLIAESGNRIYFGDLGNKFRVHFSKDMFTSARYGNKPTVLIPTGASGTIPALREASAIQRFLDIISITGQRYFDKVKGLFGVEPVGPKDDRVEFLGRYQSYVKVGEVITTATTDNATTGDYAGRGILVDGKYIFKRRFTEHGWLMCITSVVPEIAYSGLGRDLTDINPLDTPIPVMAQVGDQTIFNREVGFSFENAKSAAGRTYNNNSFGDQFRYYAYKSHNNEVHGAFLMDSMRSWSPLQDFESVGPHGSKPDTHNVIAYSKVRPEYWNYLFNDTEYSNLFGDRFFMNLNFHVSFTRALPKYINYHL